MLQITALLMAGKIYGPSDCMQKIENLERDGDLYAIPSGIYTRLYTMDLYFMHYLTKCSNREKIYGPSDCMQKI
jgi:hypothetical protein